MHPGQAPFEIIWAGPGTFGTICASLGPFDPTWAELAVTIKPSEII